jgi:hypothetical protein
MHFETIQGNRSPRLVHQIVPIWALDRCVTEMVLRTFALQEVCLILYSPSISSFVMSWIKRHTHTFLPITISYLLMCLSRVCVQRCTKLVWWTARLLDMLIIEGRRKADARGGYVWR